MKRQNGINAWLCTFRVGQREYVECTPDNYAQQMRQLNSPKSRRPTAMDGMKFSTALGTVVFSARDIRHVICVTREI